MHFYLQIMQKNVCKLVPKIYKIMQEIKCLKVNSYWGLLHACVSPCVPVVLKCNLHPGRMAGVDPKERRKVHVFGYRALIYATT